MRYVSAYQDRSDVDPLDARFLDAAELMLRDPALSSADRERLLKTSVRIAELCLQTQILSPNDDHFGAFVFKKHYSTGGTFLQGLMSLLSFLPPQEQSLAQDLRAAIDRGVIYILRAQVPSGEFRGWIRRDVQKPDVRLDYSESALVALIRYASLLQKN
jgi:hypothetical protein